MYAKKKLHTRPKKTLFKPDCGNIAARTIRLLQFVSVRRQVRSGRDDGDSGKDRRLSKNAKRTKKKKKWDLFQCDNIIDRTIKAYSFFTGPIIRVRILYTVGYVLGTFFPFFFLSYRKS